MNFPEDVVYLSLYKWHHGCEIVFYHNEFNLSPLKLEHPDKEQKWLTQIKENCQKVVIKCKQKFHAILKRKQESFQYLFLKEGYYMGLLVKMCVGEIEITHEDEDFLRWYIQGHMTKDFNALEIETQTEVDGFLVEKKEERKEVLAPTKKKECCTIL